MQNYGFSPTDEENSTTINSMNEQLLSDMQRDTKRGLNQAAATQKPESKGRAPQQVWEQFRSSSRLNKHTQQKWTLRLFRFGFAGVFLINAVVAWLQPEDFLNLMNKSLAVNWLGRLEWLIPVIALNDLTIAIVILAAPKRYRPYVYAWVGIWFLAITMIKLTALNIFTS